MKPDEATLREWSQTARLWYFLKPPLLLHHPEMMFYSLARLDLHRSIWGFDAGERKPGTFLTSAALRPQLRGPQRVYDRLPWFRPQHRWPTLLKAQSWSLLTLLYSPSVHVSGARWRNMLRKSFMHDKRFPATNRDCCKKVLTQLWPKN